MANRGPIIYSSDAGLNQSLGNLAGVLGQALAVYNQPDPIAEPIKLPDRFKLVTDMKNWGLSNEQIQSYQDEDLNRLQQLREAYSQSATPAQAFELALAQHRQEQQQQEQQAQQEDFNALSPFEKYKSSFTGPNKESADNISTLLNTLKQNPSAASSIIGLITGNTFSNSQSTPDNDSLIGAGKKGFKSSIGAQARTASQGIGYEEFIKNSDIKGKNWAKKLAFDLGQTVADAPIIASSFGIGSAAGASLGSFLGPVGSAVGGVVGGGAAANAIPELLRSSLDEYMKYTDKGGNLNFGEFLKSASEIGVRTGQAGGTGALLGLVSKFKLDKVPAVQKLLNLKGGKVTKEFLDVATQAGIVTTVKSAAKGEFPSMEEYQNTLTNLVGFKIFNTGTNKFKSFYNNLKKAGVSPQQAAQNIATNMQASGLNPINPSDMMKVKDNINKFVFNTTQQQSAQSQPVSQRQSALAQVKQQQAQQQASVTPVQMTQPLQQTNAVQVQSEPQLQPQQVVERQLPVTKARSQKTPAPVKEEIKKVQGTDKSVFNPNQDSQTISEISQNIANRPVKEYIDFELDKASKEANLTIREQAKRDLAKETADQLSKDLKIVKSDLDDVKSNMQIQGLSTKLKASYQGKKAELEKQIQNIESNLKQALDIARTGQKRATQQETEIAADKRISQLLEDALNPKSISGEKTTKDLARDEKYINDLSNIVNKGELPLKKATDFGIKQLQTYQDKYKNMLEKVKENLITAPQKEVANLTAYKNLLEKNISVNDAKIQLRKDKANVLANLEGAKGALIKQNLKDLRKDIDSFQKDFVKVSKVQNIIESKTQKAALERLATTKGQKDLMDALQSNDLQEASIITSIPLNDLKTILKNTNRHSELIIKAMQKKQSQNSQKSQSKTDGSENIRPDVKSSFDSFKDYLDGLGILPKTFAKQALALALKLGAKATLGINIPSNWLKGLGTGAGSLLSYPIVNKIYKFYNDTINSKEDKDFAIRLKKAKTPVERERVYIEMNEKNIPVKRRKHIDALRYTL